jgi:hypothetical protein
MNYDIQPKYSPKITSSFLLSNVLQYTDLAPTESCKRPDMYKIRSAGQHTYIKHDCDTSLSSLQTCVEPEITYEWTKQGPRPSRDKDVSFGSRS